MILMKTMITPLLGSALLSAGYVAANSRPVYPNCAKLTFTMTATASNYVFPLNVSVPELLLETIQDSLYTVGAAFTATSKIVARYCEPEVYIPGRADQLEFLLHSFSNNKNFWSGFGEPGKGYEGDAYSWIAYASKQGYPTLSLDRLGNGESDHPDPILVVQGPYEYALYHQMLQQIKSGTGSPLPRTYKDIILIGNSYGSTIIDNILALYPNDVNKAILSGYTYDVRASFPGIVGVGPTPAALVLPQRFGTLPLGYVTTTVESARRGAFYGVSPIVLFPYNITVLDNNVRDVISIGDFITNYVGQPVVANSYTGRALVLTGEEDNAFCGDGTTSLVYPIKCGQRIPDTRKLFPKADYSWYSVDKTGHSNNFHYSRFESFKVAHDFIAGAKFSKTGGL